MLERMGLNSFRCSIEWSRIEPTPGDFDVEAIARYREEISAVRAARIEPMVTLGTGDTSEDSDGWTVRTTDGAHAAHWEHTVAVTTLGVWVLTAADGGRERLAALGVPFGALAD